MEEENRVTLGQLIEELRKHEPKKVVRKGFANPHSYRGYYDQLAFEPAHRVSVEYMLTLAEGALGETYTGWKGGEYTMDEYTECWLAFEGSASDSETIGPLLLNYILNDTV